MRIVDVMVDLEQLKWHNIPDGMELKICSIPAGATILSAAPEPDGMFHVRYVYDDGNPCTLSMSIG